MYFKVNIIEFLIWVFFDYLVFNLVFYSFFIFLEYFIENINREKKRLLLVIVKGLFF